MPRRDRVGAASSPTSDRPAFPVLWVELDCRRTPPRLTPAQPQHREVRLPDRVLCLCASRDLFALVGFADADRNVRQGKDGMLVRWRSVRDRHAAVPVEQDGLRPVDKPRVLLDAVEDEAQQLRAAANDDKKKGKKPAAKKKKKKKGHGKKAKTWDARPKKRRQSLRSSSINSKFGTSRDRDSTASAQTVPAERVAGSGMRNGRPCLDQIKPGSGLTAIQELWGVGK